MRHMRLVFSICEVTTFYGIYLGIREYDKPLLGLSVIWALCLLCFELQRAREKRDERQRLEEANYRRVMKDGTKR